MKISITVSNSLKKDPRVIKQVRAAIEKGYDVQFVGYRDKFLDTDFLGNLGCKYNIVDLGPTYVGHLNSIFKKIKRAFLQFIKPIQYMCNYGPDIIHCNDFDTLVYSYIAAKLCHAAIVYDSHEVYAENIGIVNNWFRKHYTLFFERILLKRINKMICVSNAASVYFSQKYHIDPPTVVTNCPMKNTLPLLEHNIEKFEVVYQGLMVEGRGYEEFIESALFLDDRFRNVLRGYGPIQNKLSEIIESNNLQDIVTFSTPVEVSQLVQAASSSHVGVVLTRPVNLNFDLSVSNKVFEYVHAGLPVIMSNIAEHKYLNDLYDFAIIIEEVSPKCIAEAIRLLHDDKELYNRLANNARKMSRKMHWEKEAEKLFKIYQEISHDRKQK